MRAIVRNWLTVFLAGCAALAIASTASCRSSDRTGPAPGDAAAPTTQNTAEDTLAGSDAQRARAALRKNRPDEGAQRPAAPDDRSSTSVVDQPRVGGVRR